MVSNCHKVSSKEFERIELSVEAISKEINAVIHKIKAINPSISIIYTISPIRYIQQGFVENTISKGKLFSALSDLLQIDSNAYYFPAYEMVIDELRDYRFFKNDFAHPNEMAINYVWERLSSWMDNNTLEYLKDIEEFLKFKNHRVLNPDQQKQHLDQITIRKNAIQKKYPILKIDHD
jgi:hypothetical protein